MTLPRGVRCVVFDLDDTLYLERDYVRSGFAAVGHHLKETQRLEAFASRAWEKFCSGLRSRIFDVVLAEMGQHPTPALVNELVSIYRNHRPAIVLEPDALAALDALRDRFQLAVITDGPAESQRAKVEALGLTRWMRQIIITAEHGPDFAKPNPAAFRLIEDRFHLDGAECVYVGDNPDKDFQAPSSLGWTTIRVLRPLGLYSRADGPANLQTVSSLAALTALCQYRAC